MTYRRYVRVSGTRLSLKENVPVVSSAIMLLLADAHFYLCGLLSSKRPARMKMTVWMSQRNFMPVTVDTMEDRVAAASL